MGGHSFSRTPRQVPKVSTSFRRIQTPIPAPGTEEILARLDRVESRSMHGQMPIVWDRAEDFSVYDTAGNRWIDFTSTIFVANIGHSNPRLRDALRETLDRPLLHTYAYANEIRARYLERLLSFAPEFEKAFLLSAGTEATEATLKLMRLHGAKSGKRRPGVVCIEGNWHGRTMGAQLMGGNAKQKEWIGFLDPNIHHIPFPYPWAMDGASGEDFARAGLARLAASGIDPARDLCGVLLETFQGWGAVFYPNDFVRQIRDFCDGNGLLLAFDEMQSGFARTGKRFGYEHYGARADLLACGKGIASGLPLSAVLGSADVMDLPETGDMSSTHSANPLVCAAGLATIEEIEGRDLVARAAREGGEFHDRLRAIQAKFPDRIAFVLGKGLLAAVHLRDPATGKPDGDFATRVCVRAMEKGLLLVCTGRESIKMAPPLTMPREAWEEGLYVLEEAIGEIAREA